MDLLILPSRGPRFVSMVSFVAVRLGVACSRSAPPRPSHYHAPARGGGRKHFQLHSQFRFLDGSVKKIGSGIRKGSHFDLAFRPSRRMQRLRLGIPQPKRQTWESHGKKKQKFLWEEFRENENFRSFKKLRDEPGPLSDSDTARRSFLSPGQEGEALAKREGVAAGPEIHRRFCLKLFCCRSA